MIEESGQLIRALRAAMKVQMVKAAEGRLHLHLGSRNQTLSSPLVARL